MSTRKVPTFHWRKDKKTGLVVADGYPPSVYDDPKVYAETMAKVRRAQARIGRPSLTGRKGTTPSLHLRLPPALMASLKQEAEKRGLTVSAIARERIEGR